MPGSLSLRVVGDCTEGILDTFEFYPGEVKTLKLQLFDTENDQKLCIPSEATKTLYLSASPDNLQINNADITVDSTDSSIFSTPISSAMSSAMITGSIQFQFVVSSPASTRIAYLDYGLKRMVSITR